MAVIIHPPTIDWDGSKHRTNRLLGYFAADGHEVYYCDKTQDETKPMSYPRSNFAIVHDNRAFIRHMVPQMKRKKKRIVLWITNPKHYVFAEQYFPDAVVFDYNRTDSQWTPYFGRMLFRSDIFFASSKPIIEKAEHDHPLLRCEYVPNENLKSGYERIREALSDHFPEIFLSVELASAETDELMLLIERVQRNLVKAAEEEPHMMAAFLRNMNQTLQSILETGSVRIHHNARTHGKNAR